MIQFDWSNILTEEIEVELSQHGVDRSKDRYGVPQNIEKREIEDIVNQAEDSLLKSINKYSTFVIHSFKNKLNVIGALVKKGTNYIFKVITVMFKDYFKPKPDDKFIAVYESRDYQISEIIEFLTFKEFQLYKGI